MSVVLAIFIINMVTNQLHYVVIGRLSAITLSKMILIQFVIFSTFLVPLGGFIAVLSVFGRLYSSNEITILRACGVSNSKLLFLLLSFGLMLTDLASLLSFWVSPQTEGQQSLLIAKTARSIATNKVLPLRFNRIAGDANKVIYAQSNNKKNKVLKHVLVVQVSQDKPPSPTLPMAGWDMIVGNSMKVDMVPLHGRKYPFMVVNNGRRYHFDDKQGLLATQFKQQGIFINALKIGPPLWPQSANIEQLFNYLVTKQSPKVLAQTFLRLAVPISVIVLIIIAFGLTKINLRKGRLNYLFPAIIFYSLYSNSIFMFKNWIANQKILFVNAMLLVHGLPLLIAIVIIFFRHGGTQWFKRVTLK